MCLLCSYTLHGMWDMWHTIHAKISEPGVNRVAVARCSKNACKVHACAQGWAYHSVHHVKVNCKFDGFGVLVD